MRFARFAAATAAVTLAIGGFSATAMADPGPKWHDGPFYSPGVNTLTATGSITGVGGDDLTIVLDAKATATCQNKPGKFPKGLQRSTQGSIDNLEVKNGRVDFTVTTDEVEGKCPGKMTPTVTFTSATLTVFQDGAVVLTDSHTF